jgi:hypothetical protein
MGGATPHFFLRSARVSTEGFYTLPMCLCCPGQARSFNGERRSCEETPSCEGMALSPSSLGEGTTTLQRQRGPAPAVRLEWMVLDH